MTLFTWTYKHLHTHRWAFKTYFLMPDIVKNTESHPCSPTLGWPVDALSNRTGSLLGELSVMLGKSDWSFRRTSTEVFPLTEVHQSFQMTRTEWWRPPLGTDTCLCADNKLPYSRNGPVGAPYTEPQSQTAGKGGDSILRETAHIR